MAQSIVNIQQMGDALRNTGYKTIESAVSEIIDNAIDAEANDIFVIVKSTIDPNTSRKGVTEIAFLDNGNGMDLEKLGSCLGLGFTTRQGRKGMGRFGVGLPQSSMYACPSVDVYSWQNGYENCHKVFLDINKVTSGEQTQIDDPVPAGIPDKYKTFLKYKTEKKQYDFKQNGTFVHWKNCDRVSPKMITPLFKRLQFQLGRKFRYLIANGSHNIRLIDSDDGNQIDIVPNDPLFLMNPNFIMGNPNDPGNPLKGTEPLFEPFTNETCKDGIVRIPVKYVHKESRKIEESEVLVKFSKVRDIFYDQTAFAIEPGKTTMGKFVGELEGISIVRAGREIDSGMFDFYSNINQPQHRWWGCEISFETELDEAFGVANNKQNVELHSLDKNDYKNEEVQPMWIQLYTVVHTTIGNMYAKNQALRQGSRSTGPIVNPPATEIINTVEKKNPTEGITDIVKLEVPIEELEDRAKEALGKSGKENLTPEIVNNYIKNKMNFSYEDRGSAGIFDYTFTLGTCSVFINTSHIFYKTFLAALNEDLGAKTAFELFIGALVKTIEEQSNDRDQELIDTLVQRWNIKLRSYINEQTGYGK